MKKGWCSAAKMYRYYIEFIDNVSTEQITELVELNQIEIVFTDKESAVYIISSENDNLIDEILDSGNLIKDMFKTL